MGSPQVTTLGDVMRDAGGSIRTGPFGTAVAASEYTIDGAPVVSVGEVGHGKLRITAGTRRVPPEVTRRLPQYVLKEGDIVFGRKGAVDRSALIEGHEQGYFLGSDGIRLRLGDSVDPKFIAYWLQTSVACEWLVRHSVGTTMLTLTQPVLDSLPVTLPEINEQHEVSSALDSVDALARSLAQLIVKKRAIKQGMMQELLTGRTRLPGFSDGWKVAQFGEIASPSKDRVNPRSVTGRVVELEHLAGGSGVLLGDVDSADCVSLKTRFSKGDVLFGKLRAYLRKYWFADRDGFASTEIWALRARPEIALGLFLRYVVEQDSFIEAASTAYGTHMPRSDWKVVSRYEIRLPPLEEQAAIGRTLQDADAEIAALERRLESTRAVKQGMMQELLTGRTRLAVTEGEPE